MNTDTSFNFLLFGTLALLLCWCLGILSNIIPEPLEMRRSEITGKKYGVQEMLENAHDTADVLARLDMFIKNFVDYLVANEPDDPRSMRLKQQLRLLHIEESPFEDNVSSFTRNKGELMSLCVRSKPDSNFHDYQTLLFVVIHEMAHVASLARGHGPEFVTNFKWLLTKAADSGMYTPVDYRKNPISYCGVDVTNNPML
jgi:hypothetical protein